MSDNYTDRVSHPQMFSSSIIVTDKVSLISTTSLTIHSLKKEKYCLKTVTQQFDNEKFQ